MRSPSTATRRPSNVTPSFASWCRLRVWPPFLPVSCGLGANLALGEGSWSSLLDSALRDAPEHGVLTPIPARPSYSAAHAQVHVTATLVQFFGELAAGIGTAYNQHCTRRQAARIAIVAGVQLKDIGRQGTTERGRLRELKRARGNYDNGRHITDAGCSSHAVASAVWCWIDGRDPNPAVHRSLEAGGVPFEVAHYVRTRHESIRIASLIGKAGQLDCPVRGHQRKGVPPCVPPSRRIFPACSSTTCGRPSWVR